MSTEEFWEIVENARRKAAYDPDLVEQNLRAILRKLPPSDVAQFDRQATAQYHRAYDHQLWAGAFVMRGGCGDDGFMDFRQALIGLGRNRFESALANPESLADVTEAEEDFLYTEMFLSCIGEILDEMEITPETHNPDHPREPSGEDWDEEGIELKFPRLKARFWDAD